MNKKIYFSLFLIFICLFSCTSCFAVSDYGFTIEFIEQCIENYSDNIKSYIEQYNCKNYIVRASDTSAVTIMLSDGTFSLGSYYESSTGKQGYCWFKNDGTWLNNTGSFGIGRPSYSSKTDYIYASSQEEISSVRINSLDILMGLVEPEPEEPYIEMSKTEYTENDNSVDLYVYSNDFDITNYGFTLFTGDNSEEYVPVVQYFSPGTQSKFDSYYNSGESRYEIDLNDFFDFKFSDDIVYQVGIYEYNSSGDNTPFAVTDKFKIKFGDSYVVEPGGSFDITPKINVNTTESTTSVVVSITSDVPDSYIYYKIEDSSWHAYTEPLNVDYNCTIYAHAWTSGGSSGYSSVVIDNIISESEFIASRPLIESNDVEIYKKIAGNKSYTLEWKVLDRNINYTWLFSFDGMNWINAKKNFDFSDGLVYQHYYYEFTLNNFPVNLNFKYYDSSTGLYSDVLTKTITEKEFNTDGVITPSYDENNKYDPDNVIDFNNSSNNSFVDSGLDFSNSENLLDSAWSSVDNTWAMFATFFGLINGIWIFIPDEIMYLIVSLIIIKFIIAVIGFIRG